MSGDKVLDENDKTDADTLASKTIKISSVGSTFSKRPSMWRKARANYRPFEAFANVRSGEV